MKRLRTEVFWLIGMFILAYWVLYSMLGKSLSNGRVLEIQKHDSYYIVPKSLLIILTFVLLSVLMYVLRWFHFLRIEKRMVVTILSLATIVLGVLFLQWLNELGFVRQLDEVTYMKQNETDRIQMTLLSHIVFTIAVGFVVLLDMALVLKIVSVRSNEGKY